MGYYTFDVQVSYVGTHTFSSNLRAFIFTLNPVKAGEVHEGKGALSVGDTAIVKINFLKGPWQRLLYIAVSSSDAAASSIISK